MLSSYKLYIFDFDGTIRKLRVTSYITSIFKIRYKRFYLSKYKINNINLEVIEKEYKFFAKFYGLFAGILPPRMIENVDSFINLLKNDKKKIAIFSDSKAFVIVKDLRKMGLIDYFDYILSADLLDRYKPNPSGLIYLLNRFKTDKRDAIYIGDMPVDIITAKLAGIDSCAVSTGLGNIKSLRWAKPNFVFKDYNEIIRAYKG